MRARIDFLERLAGVGKNNDTDWGPGRVDAFGSARRFLFDADYEPVHGVSYPHLWDLHRTRWFHYDSNTNTFLERNIGQALGVGAVFDKGTFRTSVRMDNLHVLDTIAAKLRAPKWPEEVFGKIDRDRVKKGHVLYEQHCVKCHATDAKWKEHLSMDTDPGRALSFALPTPDGTAFPDAVKATLGKIKATALKDLPAADRDAILRRDKAPSIWRAEKKYSGRPLVAAWATAPYLHNGSVPTLAHLLEKAKDRPVSFHVGSREYDPVNLGYVWKGGGKADNYFVHRGKGNTNIGHEHGTDLSADDKKNLLEYLKAN